MLNHVRSIFVAAAIVYLALSLAACSRHKAPAANSNQQQAAQGNRVDVTLTDFKIDMPAELPAGPTIFRVTNNGPTDHSFEIDGTGIQNPLGWNLRTGQTREMRVDLKPGTYNVFCPIANHSSLGMMVKLTVTG